MDKRFADLLADMDALTAKLATPDPLTEAYRLLLAECEACRDDAACGGAFAPTDDSRNVWRARRDRIEASMAKAAALVAKARTV